MRTMLKLGAVFCAICFVLFLFAGCNGDPNSGKETGADAAVTEPVVKPSDDGSIELPMIPG